MQVLKITKSNKIKLTNNILNQYTNLEKIEIGINCECSFDDIIFPQSVKIIEIYSKNNKQINNFPPKLETLILDDNYNHEINFDSMHKLSFISVGMNFSKNLSEGKFKIIYFRSTKSSIPFLTLPPTVITVILANVSNIKEKLVNLPSNLETLHLLCDDKKALESIKLPINCRIINEHLNQKYKELEKAILWPSNY